MRNVVRGVSSAVFSLQGALAGVGAGLIARQFLSVASSFEQMEIKLDALTQGRGTQTLEAINDWAKNMPVDTQKAVDTFSTMIATGLDPTLEKMTTLVDVSVLFGEDALPRVSRALGQMASLGKLSSEELNQLAEVGINARKILRDAFGKSVEELQKSNIEIQEIIEAIWDGLAGQFGGAAERAQNTWQGLMVQIRSEFVEAQRQIAEAGLFQFLKEGLKAFREALNELTLEERLQLFKRISDGIISAIGFIAKAIAVVADAWRGWELIWLSLKTIYADFAAFVNDATLDIARSVDRALTLLEVALNSIGQKLQDLEAATGGFIEFGFADTLADTDALSTKLDGVIGALEDGRDFWKEIAAESSKALRTVAAEEPALTRVSRIFEEIRDRAEKLTEERQKQILAARQEGLEIQLPQQQAVEIEPVVTQAAELKAQLTELQAVANRQLAEITESFNRGVASAQNLYDKRVEFATEAFEIERNLLLEAEGRAKNVDQRRQINAQIIALEENYYAELAALDRQREEDVRAQQERETEIRVLAKQRQAREIAALTTAEAGLSAQFTQELLQLDQRHAEELQRLRDLNASKAEIEEEFRVQQLERDKVAAEQRKQLFQTILEASSRVTGDVASAFKDLYEAGGKQSKTFFRIYKAAAIAQAIIDTYKGATAAFSALAGIPYVGPALGIAAAAAAIAAGIARVAVIRQQNFGAAEGGLIPGKSPHPKADNIPVRATAGEFMQPVETVRHYSTKVMEAIRKRIVPVEVLRQYGGSIRSVVNAKPIRRYAEGGPIVFEKNFNRSISRISNSIKNFASGGPITGYSPHPKADNITIQATAGEYVHPVSSVKYYGTSIMNAIRQRAVPREILAGFKIPDVVNVQRNFQAGGAISAAAVRTEQGRAAKEAAKSAEERINITNVTDPNLMGQFLQTRPGEQQILNIISENSQLVKQSLFARDG